MISRPLVAEELPVKFEDLPDHGGLLLKYDQFKNLAKNITELRRYIADLESSLAYYETMLNPTP